ncbi:MAG: hypothetical protein LBB55_06010 [Zoogloeaceae bacterium]|jgi:hypothetical protein|nr:hypothetical protein [Zoogloeaceae bacterium]
MLSAIGSTSPFDWLRPYAGNGASVDGNEARVRPEAGKSVGKTAEQTNEVEGAGSEEEDRQEEKETSLPGEARKPGGEVLSDAEKREVLELKQTDREVRQHEQQHMAAGGNLVTGGPSYTYQQGPDGKRYAVGGEVSIDTSEGKTPEETLVRARRIRAAALAPAEPSPKDRQVAAMATQMEMTALREIAQARMSGEDRGGEEKEDGKEDAASGAAKPGQGRMATEAYRQGERFGVEEAANPSRFSAVA